MSATLPPATRTSPYAFCARGECPTGSWGGFSGASPARVLGRVFRGIAGNIRELIEREIAFLRLARAFRPDLIVGTTAHGGRVGRLVRATSVVLNEDDARVVPLFRWVCYPFATAIVTPECLAYENYGERHLTYRSYHELFYLHPNRFTPDRGVLRELGLADGERYAVVRLSGLEAHHDSGSPGLREALLREVVTRRKGTRVVLSSERKVSSALASLCVSIPPEKMHHVLAFAQFFLGDSQTMTAEAAVLGVPAFRISEFVGRLSYLAELERYGLAFGFRPTQEDALLKTMDEVLGASNHEAGFRTRREKLLSERIDPLPWFLGVTEELVMRRKKERPS